MTDKEFLLEDRIAKIQAINEEYDLENNAYLSFSGGKDSTILHYLLDMALPNNKIPRVFVNTGIEFLDIVKFVKELAKTDDRFIILNNTLNIRKTLETYGYPFKSKAFAHNYSIFQHIGEESKTYRKMRDDSSKFGIPKILEYMFKDKNAIPFKISEMCCYKMKKQPVEKWSKENNRKICITGMRKDEGGNREQLTCTIFDNDNLTKFHPLVPIDDQWENWFVERERE